MKYLFLLLLPAFFYIKIGFENRKVRLSGERWKATAWQSPSRMAGAHRNVGESGGGRY